MKIPHLPYVLTFIGVSIVGAQDLATFDFSTASFGATTIDSGLSSITLETNGAIVSTDTDPSDGAIDEGTYLFYSDYLFTNRTNWDTWGNANSNETGPFTLEVEANAGYNLSISGLTIQTQSSQENFSVHPSNVVFAFHQDGEATFKKKAVNPGANAVMTFDTPVEVSAGMTQVFNIRINSGTDSNQHIFSGMSLQGSSMAVPEPSSYALITACFALVAVMLRRRYYI